MPEDTMPTSESEPDDYRPLPLDTDEDEQARGLEENFQYIGRGLTQNEFAAYVESYPFPSSKPDFIVLHHTLIPGTVYSTPNYRPRDLWDAGEMGMSADAVKNRRKDRLDGVMTYYRDTLKWTRGPHLFIDDRFIWLFTPMNIEGIHAMDNWGNFFTGTDGRKHYSIGIEVVGGYDNKPWPDDVAGMVGYAVAVLKRKLGTFDLKYLYENPSSKPGREDTGRTNRQGNKIYRCAHPDRLRWGGITSHRDYNKPECPGAKITEQFYMRVLNEGWTALQGVSSSGVDIPIKGAATISPARFTAVLKEYDSPAFAEADTLYQMAVQNGIDPAVALAFFVQTSKAGTGYANPAKATNHNWGEVPGDRSGIGGLQAYPSWAEGLQGWIAVMMKYHNEGVTTLGDVVRRYGLSNPPAAVQAMGTLLQSWRS
jgi:hypothetical protein